MIGSCTTERFLTGRRQALDKQTEQQWQLRDTAHEAAKNKSMESNSEPAPERKGSQHCRRMGYHPIIPPFVGERAA